MILISGWIVGAAALTLIPFLAAAFFPDVIGALQEAGPLWLRLCSPAAICVPYLMVAAANRMLDWRWAALYLFLPMAVTYLLWRAAQVDPEQRGTWFDLVVLLVLGLAVDLRWFESAWPARMAVFNKILLLDLGIYGFLVIRRLDCVGFDLRLRGRDCRIGFRELIFYMPIALVLGLGLGFLHLHNWRLPWFRLVQFPVAAVFTFLFVAVPEELYFRGWMQNLLERRMGRNAALATTAVLFGLAHWNKRALHFNWKYVIVAALAGVFYGRAWREERRVGASAFTHAGVDTIWSFWLK